MMLEDSKDLLDNVEVTTVADQCVKLKQKEDEIASLEEQLKNKKAEADDISSRVIPELPVSYTHLTLPTKRIV